MLFIMDCLNRQKKNIQWVISLKDSIRQEKKDRRLTIFSKWNNPDINEQSFLALGKNFK